MSEHPQHRGLVAALDVVLPGDDGFPAASQIALAAHLLDHPACTGAVCVTVERPGDGLANRDAAGRIATVASLERDDPTLLAIPASRPRHYGIGRDND